MKDLEKDFINPNISMVEAVELRMVARVWVDLIESKDTLYDGNIHLLNWIRMFFNLEDD